MRATSILLLSTVVVVLGRWSKGQGISPKIVVGGALLAIIFSVFESSQPKLAQQFAWLVFAGIVTSYGEDLFGGVGKAVGVKPTQGEKNAHARGTSGGPGAYHTN